MVKRNCIVVVVKRGRKMRLLAVVGGLTVATWKKNASGGSLTHGGHVWKNRYAGRALTARRYLSRGVLVVSVLVRSCSLYL